MRILITGGCGFIGSHLAEYLLERGERVEVLDDLSSGSLKNVFGIKKHPNFSCVIGSVLDYQLSEKIVRRNDFIFHLAAAVGGGVFCTHPFWVVFVFARDVLLTQIAFRENLYWKTLVLVLVLVLTTRRKLF